MGWQNFNDRLALLILVLIPLLWIVQGLGRLNLASEVTGALIITWGMVIQYYFRKQPPTGGS